MGPRTASILLVRGARQLLTLRGSPGPRRGVDLTNLGLIQDGVVLIVDGKIHDVGPGRRVENLALARQAVEVDASGKVVLPGFIDSHTHMVGAPARLLHPGGDAMSLARAIHNLAPRTLEAQARNAVEHAVRHGTTTLESKSGLGLTEANEIKILRVQSALRKQSIPLISTLLCLPPSPDYRESPEQHVEWLCSRLLHLAKRRKLAEFASRFECPAD